MAEETFSSECEDKFTSFKAEHLRKIPGNISCADCGQPEPCWASCSFGILVCDACGSVHSMTFGTDKNEVIELSSQNWTDDQVEKLKSTGNTKSNEIYERHVPHSYRRPKPKDPSVLLEQWIKAKYERREFMTKNASLPYLKDHKEGYLWKQGKGSRHFNRRKFVLDAFSNTLKYYNKEGAKEPKAVLSVEKLNVLVVPEKIGNPNGMQIMFEQDNYCRSIFVYADTGEDMIVWYTALRHAKLSRLAIAYPATAVEDLCGMLSTDFVKEGWLNKSGPKRGDAYRRRWMTLDKRKFMYYDDPLNPFPKGEIFIGSNAKNFYVSDDNRCQEKNVPNAFTVHTPERVFHFSVDSVSDRDDWMLAFRSVINTPVTPKEQSSAINKKRSSVRESMIGLLKR